MTRPRLRRTSQQSAPKRRAGQSQCKAGAVLNELANILEGDLAAKYLPLVGDLRKVKRFINAILLMQIEKTSLEQLQALVLGLPWQRLGNDGIITVV